MTEQSLIPHCNGNDNIYIIFIPNYANVIFKKNHIVFWFDRKKISIKPPKTKGEIYTSLCLQSVYD